MKSFIRLVRSPNAIIASSFSEITVSIGYVEINGGASPRSDGIVLDICVGYTESPIPTSICRIILAFPINEVTFIRFSW